MSSHNAGPANAILRVERVCYLVCLRVLGAAGALSLLALIAVSGVAALPARQVKGCRWSVSKQASIPQPLAREISAGVRSFDKRDTPAPLQPPLR